MIYFSLRQAAAWMLTNPSADRRHMRILHIFDLALGHGSRFIELPPA
jgi:hypothetical protein